MFESVTAPMRPNWKLRIVFAIAVLFLGAGFISVWRVTQMPLRSYRGPLLSLSLPQSQLAALLEQHVRYLAGTIGERNLRNAGSLKATADYLRSNLIKLGYAVNENTYQIDGQAVSNLEAEIPGAASGETVVVVGAHYDSAIGTVGADDNASGVAATLELARVLRARKFRRTVRLLFFVNEEPPYFQTDQMGSLVYARSLREQNVEISAMISLEMLGFYSDAEGSQEYPALLSLFYPSRGDFIGFVGNGESRDLVCRAVRKFRQSTSFPSEGLAGPSTWPGVGWSDHWSFWQQGHPAIMITDTALFRNPNYHTAGDTPEKLDFAKMARVVDGTRAVVAMLADEP